MPLTIAICDDNENQINSCRFCDDIKTARHMIDVIHAIFFVITGLFENIVYKQ